MEVPRVFLAHLYSTAYGDLKAPTASDPIPEPFNIELSCPADHRTAVAVPSNCSATSGSHSRGQLQRFVMSNPTFSLHCEFSSSSWSILSVFQYFPELPRLNNGDIPMRAEDQEILIARDDVVNRSLFCQGQNVVV